MTEFWGGYGESDDGTVHGEIPLFEPGAGSAASAGMTEWARAGMTELGAR